MATYKIQYRRSTAAVAAASNPVLGVGEPGMETDTGKEKLGDGVTAWNALPYKINTASANATYVAPVNVKAYGAKGDGITDDTAAIEAAQVVARAQKRPLYLPGGTYLVAPATDTAAITLTTLGPLAGITYCYGDGDQLTVLKVTSTGGRGIDLGVYGTHFLEIEPITLRDLWVDGPGKAVGTGIGIRGRNAAKGHATNVRVSDFGSHGIDFRNCNSWNFHNYRATSNGGKGVMGNYATSRDAADPGIAQAENNSANHAWSFTGTTLLDDNGSHGLDIRGVFLFTFHGVSQRNGGVGLSLQDVYAMDVHAYTEANTAEGVRLGLVVGGTGTACKNGKVVLFASKSTTGGPTALFAYACIGMDISVYSGSYTAVGDNTVVLDTSFTGTVEGRGSGGSGNFLKLVDGTTLAATDDAFRFGAAQNRGTDPAKPVQVIKAAATPTSDVWQVLDSAGGKWLYVGSSGIVTASQNVVAQRNLSLGASSGSGGGVVCIPIQNATTVPATNSGNGGQLYAEGGALKWRGSAGTITVIGPA